MKPDWLQSPVSEAEYIGWRGLGPLLGVRYFANVCDGYLILVEKYPFGGVKTQWISNLSVIHRILRRPSLFYFVCTVLSASFANMATIFDSTKLLLNKDMDGLINLSWWLLGSAIIGVILSWLFDRPRVDLVVEGGIRVGTYAGFNHSRLSALIKNWSGDRGQITAETAGASSKYFVYVTRADKTPMKAVTIRRIVWFFIMYIVLFVGITMLGMGATAVYLYIQFVAE